MAKLTVNDLDVRGKRVFVRVDYNVPMEEKDGKMVINDATRIKETLPTLDLLINKGARIILAAHLGRPKGQREPSMSLRPVAEKLADMINRPVAFVDDCIGEKVEKTVGALKDGDVLLLENVRYYNEEEANDAAFAEKLAKVADVYVNDAFGAAHRAHASTEGVARIVARRGGKCAAGLLMERELKFLGDELEKPARPFVVILGGAKVSDKIKVIDNLLPKVNTLLIGGAMAYTFLKAQGVAVGKSRVEEDKLALATRLLESAKRLGVELVVPVDHVVGTSPDEKSAAEEVAGRAIPDGKMGLDIGRQTRQLYRQHILGARTVLWHGPMGLFEVAKFAEGTRLVAEAMAANTKAQTVVGGGDSAAAVNDFHLAEKMTHVSTGGGASLEYLGGQDLPGVEALTKAPKKA